MYVCTYVCVQFGVQGLEFSQEVFGFSGVAVDFQIARALNRILRLQRGAAVTGLLSQGAAGAFYFRGAAFGVVGV